MAPQSLLALIRSDIDRYSFLFELDGSAPLGGRARWLTHIRSLVLCQGLQATVVYRIGHRLVTWRPAGAAGHAARISGRLAHFVAARMIEMVHGISIAERATIGPGLYVGHFGSIVIGAVTMGSNCNVSHQVTLGRSGRIGEHARPHLGDRVWIGPGAVISGDLTVGDDAVIGANAVVTRSVPARNAALGIPARPNRSEAAFDMVAFRAQDSDAGRLASRRLLEAEISEISVVSAPSLLSWGRATQTG